LKNGAPGTLTREASKQSEEVEKTEEPEKVKAVTLVML
jgi:hypothetical protein